MSNVKPVAKKTVKIKENELVDLIDNIINEAIEVKKQEWIAENTKKESETTSLLENRIAALEAKIKTITEGKK